MTTRWPEKDPGESITVTFSFAPETAQVTGNIEVTLFAAYGAKGDQSSITGMLVAAPQISSTDPTKVLQRIQAGASGIDYYVLCYADTVEGDRLLVDAVLPVRVRPRPR
jgi:hypothetical protein